MKKKCFSLVTSATYIHAFLLTTGAAPGPGRARLGQRALLLSQNLGTPSRNIYNESNARPRKNRELLTLAKFREILYLEKRVVHVHTCIFTSHFQTNPFRHFTSSIGKSTHRSFVLGPASENRYYLITICIMTPAPKTEPFHFRNENKAVKTLATIGG